MTRLPVRKTYKLFIGGEFPRSESGRTYEAQGQNVARASRKDVRDAVRVARGAFAKWSSLTAYNRGQILYRIAEMMEARRGDLGTVCSGSDEVDHAIDRVVWYAGWADKLPQVLGGANPVAGPYFNFTVPEPTGVVAVLAPQQSSLLGLVSVLAPVLGGGNTAVVVTSHARPLPAVTLGEVLATSDVPAGVVNLNVDGRRVVGPLQGFGPLWQKTYRVPLTGAGVTPTEVVRVWKEHFPEFHPPQNRFYPSLAGVKPGEVLLINASMRGMPVYMGVRVIYADEESFTVMTAEGLPEAGWNTFSAYTDDGHTVAQVQSLARANDPIYEIGFRIVGSTEQERI